MPASSRPTPSVTGPRPVATRQMSASTLWLFPPVSNVTLTLLLALLDLLDLGPGVRVDAPLLGTPGATSFEMS